MFYIPTWALIFHKFRGDFKKQAILFGVVSMVMIMTARADFSFQYGVLAAIIPLCFYNGERTGKIKIKAINAVGKWVAYLYYPLHIAVLIVLKY